MNCKMANEKKQTTRSTYNLPALLMNRRNLFATSVVRRAQKPSPTQAYDEKTHFGSRYDYAAKKLTLFAEASINRLVDQSSSRINALSNLLTPSCNEFIDLLYFIK